jgi:hypothetical protein
MSAKVVKEPSGKSQILLLIGNRQCQPVDSAVSYRHYCGRHGDIRSDGSSSLVSLSLNYLRIDSSRL